MPLEDLLDKTANSNEKDATYNGVDYKVSSADGSAYGIIGDFAVVGSEQGFKDAVDAYSGDSLADNSTATDALDSVPSDTLFSAYVDPKAAVDAAISGGAITQKELDQSGAADQIAKLGYTPLVFSGGATSDSISFQAAGPGGGTGASEIASTLPSGAWLAFRASDVGQTIANSHRAVRSRLRARFPAKHAEPERPVRDDGALAAADPQHRRGDQAGDRLGHHQGLRLDRRRRRLPAGAARRSTSAAGW